jgi:hypothetical protein
MAIITIQLPLSRSRNRRIACVRLTMPAAGKASVPLSAQGRAHGELASVHAPESKQDRPLANEQCRIHSDHHYGDVWRGAWGA